MRKDKERWVGRNTASSGKTRDPPGRAMGLLPTRGLGMFISNELSTSFNRMDLRFLEMQILSFDRQLELTVNCSLRLTRC